MNIYYNIFKHIRNYYQRGVVVSIMIRGYNYASSNIADFDNIHRVHIWTI